MTNFKKIAARGASVLALVTVLAASAVPAQANPSVSFSFNFGNGGHSQPYYPRPQTCYSNQQIANSLGNQGYYNVQYAGETYSGYPQFQAVNGNWVYSLQVNRCTGQIYSANRVRQVVYRPAPQPQNPWWYNQRPRPYGNSFNFNFNHN